MSNWNDNGRYHGGFPPAVRRQAERELPKVCAGCGAAHCRLWLDHIRNRASGGGETIDNAQWLCTPCHDAKSAAEARAGTAARAARGRHPVEAHPGLLPSNVAGVRKPR